MLFTSEGKLVVKIQGEEMRKWLKLGSQSTDKTDL